MDELNISIYVSYETMSTPPDEPHNFVNHFTLMRSIKQIIFHSPLEILMLSYLDLLECHNRNGIPSEGRVIAANATQSS